MIKGTKGISLLEALIASTTLVVIVLMIAPQFSRTRKSMTNLQSGMSCNALANFFATNIGSRKNAVPTRTWYFTDDDVVPPVAFPNGDLTCEATSCDIRGHFAAHGGGNFTFRNYQNIRSSATWANYWWSGHPPGNCTATYEFSASGNPRPLAAIPTFLPARFSPGEFATLINDATSDRLVDSVQFQITQMGPQLNPAIHCAAGVETGVRPNSNNSYDVKVTVRYRKKEMRGPASDPIYDCEAKTNITYEYDRDPPRPTVSAEYVSAISPTLFISGGPINTSSCNPTPPPTGPGTNLEDSRVVQMNFNSLEAGSVPLCRAEVRDSNGNLVQSMGWDLCGRIVLGGIAPTQTSLNAPNDNSNMGKWSFSLRWGTPGAGQPKLPLNRKFQVWFRNVDSAKNCDPTGGGACPTETSQYWETQEYCTNGWMTQFCPNETVPSGCGTNCPDRPRRDFSATCPVVENYFACETRCGTCVWANGETKYPDCTTELDPPNITRVGTRSFTRNPGDNFCPNPSSYCAGAPVRRVPCGGACPVGTKNDCGGRCAGENDSCGNPCPGIGQAECAGVDPLTGAPNGTRTSGGQPARNNGCEGIPGTDYVQFCPPQGTYCANTRFDDQCGNPCPIGGAPAGAGCCDRCASGSQDFESVEECLAPTSYPVGTPPPAICHMVPGGAPGTGQRQCFKPGP